LLGCTCVPGVLKNVIDWASRPYGDNPFDGKPIAIMSALKESDIVIVRG
jgi:NAD(P)H-dependent FMN reductase